MTASHSLLVPGQPRATGQRDNECSAEIQRRRAQRGSERTDEQLSPSGLANDGFATQPWVGHGARMTSYRLMTSVAVISVHGDIDASNVGALTECALGHVTGCRILILDLRGLDFFGVEGFSVLQRLATCCTRAGTAWAVVPGAAVSRMLRIGDPHASLPVADTVDAALATSR
jgi:anti-anti-sigma factor